MPDAFPPVVDLSGPDAAARMDAACRTVGFFQVVGHGVPQSLIDDVLGVMDEFFGLPLAEKATYLSEPEIERGYSAKGTEGLAYSLGLEQPPDLFEAFTMGRDDLPDAPAFHTGEHHFFAPNIWPSRPSRMRAVLVEYFDAVRDLMGRLNSTAAVALGMPADYFEQFTDASCDAVRLNYFEGRPGDTAAPQQFGIGPHTDYGIMTILLADQVPALQVYTAEEEWRYVVPAPGAFVVNVGDLLSRWTNDLWLSSLHRVMPVLTTDASVRRRRSVPFFREGNYDALVECLPTCRSAENPAKYPPITGGEHVLAKVNAGRTLEAADAFSTVGDRAKALEA